MVCSPSSRIFVLRRLPGVLNSRQFIRHGVAKLHRNAAKAAMDTERRAHRLKPAPPERRPVPRPTQAQGLLALEPVPLEPPRPELGPSSAERPCGILRLQRTVGNRVVSRLLETRVQPRPRRSDAVGSLTKTLGQEEELAKRTSPASSADVLTKTLGQEEELAKSLAPTPAAAAQPESEDRLHK